MKNEFTTITKQREVHPDRSFGHTLIVGAGPAAIQVAVHLAQGWCDQLGLLNRAGPHATQLKEELEQHDYVLSSRVQDEKNSHLSGKAKLTHFYEGYDHLDDIWQTIILCTPSDSYGDVIRGLRIHSLNKVQTILLISPSIGSNLLVTSQLEQSKVRVEVISFSTYYAATKFEPKQSSRLSCFTKAFKKRIYIASSQPSSRKALDVWRFIESLGIDCTVDQYPMEAESKSITTYVHPPFFINEFSLQQIFSPKNSYKFLYKLYPEGPLTQHSIRAMVRLWKEISELFRHFGAEPINLLKFLNDDNYPVHEITLSREDIEGFSDFEPIKQEYLLYIRYTSILIDPFSIPDKEGKYFDFSAVPYKQVYQDQNGKWKLPRIPYEDYKKLKLLYGLAQKMNLSMPQTWELIELFEQALGEFVSEKGRGSFDPDLFQDTTQNEVEAIYSEWRKV